MDVLMSGQVFDEADVGSVVAQVGAEGMTEQVWRDSLFEAGCLAEGA
jgi:hypothetical protein